MVTIDCAEIPDKWPHVRRIFTMPQSRWVDELRTTLSEVDAGATFLDTAEHFWIFLGDDVLEIVATSIEIDEIGSPISDAPPMKGR